MNGELMIEISRPGFMPNKVKNACETGWYIQSGKYYYHHINDYYKNLNRLGMFYEKFNYASGKNFLQMLPGCLGYDTR